MMQLSKINAKQWWQTLALSAMLIMPCAELTAAATPRTDVWQPNGPVYAVEMAKDSSADSVYIGGEFTYVGPDTGNSVLVSLTGTRLPTGASWPKIEGDVYSVISDGNDGWYVGGDFTIINDGADDRNRLARLTHDVDGIWSVDAWDPNVNGAVRTMVLDGTTLYVGGDFTVVNEDGVNNETRNRIAAFDTATDTNNATSWDPNVTGTSVLTMALDGTTLYIGGDFTDVNGVAAPRSHLAAIDKSSGVATSWNPNVTGTSVLTMALSGDGTTLYVGGDFTEIDNLGAGSRNRLAALDTTATTAGSYVLGWNPNANARVRTMALNGTTLYVGGDFTSVGVSTRNYIAAIDAAGAATSWAPPALPFLDATMVSVRQLKVGNGVVYTAWTGTLDGGEIGRMQAIKTSDGKVEWSAAADDSIDAMGLTANDIFLGGTFTSGGGRLRRNLAEININTDVDGAGAATDWDVVVNGPVRSIVAKEGGFGLYIGGAFSAVTARNATASDTRNNIAFLSTPGGAVEDWDPSITGSGAAVNAMALSPDEGTLYVGGRFNAIASTTRNNIASLNTTVSGVGGLNVVNPTGIGVNDGADQEVHALVVSSDNSLVFAGGAFDNIGGKTRPRVVAIKTTTGVPLASELWAVSTVNGTVRSLALSSDDKTLYLGGDFTSINDGEVGSPHTRNLLAALEINSGSGKWSVVPTVDPNVTGTSVYSLGLSSDDEMLWMGGQFGNVNAAGGRNHVARYNLKESLVTAWNPDVSTGTRIYATERTANDSLEIIGGDFTEVGGVPHKYLAVFDTARPTVTNHIAGGFYNTSPLDIIFSCTHNTTAGSCSIFYTKDGSEPTQALTPYDYIQPPPPPPDPPPPPPHPTDDITVNTTLKFFSRDEHGSVSETLSVTYVIDQTFPETTVQPDVALQDLLLSDGIDEVADIEVTFSLVCEDAGGANCDKTYFTTDGTAPHNVDGTPTIDARLYDTPLTPKGLLPLESLTLADLTGVETDVFYEMTLADIITSEATAQIRVNLAAFTLDDIPRNAVALNSIDLLRVRAYVDLAAVRLDTLSTALLGNVILNPDAVPDGAETLADIPESNLDLTQITLGSITGTAYSLAEIPASVAPPPAYILASQVPLIDVQLDGTENRIVFDAVHLEKVPLAALEARFIPGSRLFGLINLQFFSLDRAGNSEASGGGSGVKSQSYYVDIGAPRTTASPNTDDNVFTSAQNVVLTCYDFEDVADVNGATGSGCDKTYYTLDGSVPNPEDAGATRPTKIYSGPIPISTAKVLRYLSIDKVGNVEETGFDVYAFTFESSGHSGVGASGFAVWLFALLGLALRRRSWRAAI